MSSGLKRLNKSKAGEGEEETLASLQKKLED